MFKDYPKTFKLKTGSVATIRPLDKNDKKKLFDFFKRLPEKDRMFLKDDVTNKKVIDNWFENLDFKRVIPLVVEADKKIIADGTLHTFEHGWMKHIGEIRMVVDKDYRRMSVGLHLAKELYFIAMGLRLEKMVGELVTTQKRAIKIFEGLGFKREATLRNYVKDLKGHNHNMIIMTHSVTTHWNEMENMIADFSGDFSGS
ncbi:GNAT family N-acetyltransferase [candidate division KSB1 bacterium]